jgi:2-oxoglutarate ferredoxin oxidoreductase subunit beta
MRKLADLGHDPVDRLAAISLAQEYGRSLHTGVYFRDPAPRPTYDAAVSERRAALASPAPSRRQVLDRFRPKA